mmetsp:Transcript_27628/g.91792  ORF Transcript_27628/g.91792 Transcript_27628/m.91792 type:complete len:347 (-) Transcript_27628:493-1533(-)
MQLHKEGPLVVVRDERIVGGGVADMPAKLIHPAALTLQQAACPLVPEAKRQQQRQREQKQWQSCIPPQGLTKCRREDELEGGGQKELAGRAEEWHHIHVSVADKELDVAGHGEQQVALAQLTPRAVCEVQEPSQQVLLQQVARQAINLQSTDADFEELQHREREQNRRRDKNQSIFPPPAAPRGCSGRRRVGLAENHAEGVEEEHEHRGPIEVAECVESHKLQGAPANLRFHGVHLAILQKQLVGRHFVEPPPRDLDCEAVRGEAVAPHLNNFDAGLPQVPTRDRIIQPRVHQLCDELQSCVPPHADFQRHLDDRRVLPSLEDQRAARRDVLDASLGRRISRPEAH